MTLTMDEARKEAAKDGLKDLKFLYSNTKLDDPGVGSFIIITVRY